MVKNNKKIQKKNKKILIIVAIIVAILLFFLSCGRNRYTVTLKVDNKNYHEIDNVKKGEQLDKPESPEKEGHTFVGWFLDDEKFDFETPITEDLELEAKWITNEYVVTINDGLGNITTENVKYDGNISLPITPTRQGYVFLGWFVDDVQFDFDSKVKNDIEIKAKWTNAINTQYKVEHYKMDLNGKYTINPEVEYLLGTTDTYVTPSVKTYEGFKSPDAQTVNVEADGSRIVRYYYERKQYTLTLVAGNGIESVNGSGTYYYGKEVEVSATLKPGYNFKKWSNETTTTNFTYTVPAQSETITATTTIIPYTIEYELNDGVVKNANPEEYNVETTLFTLNNPTREGYTFKGWSLNGSQPVQVLSINKGTTGDLTIEAKFDANTNTSYKVKHYKMDLNGNYGEAFETENLTGTTDTDVTPSVKTYEGFESPSTQTVNVEADGSSIVRYYYERKQYTLTLVAGNGIKSVTGSGTYYYGAEVEVNSSVKAGYSFEKWSNGKTTTEFTYIVPAKSETITATTTIVPYTITYVLNGGNVSNENPTGYNVETETFTLNNPTKTGYTFVGWSLNGSEPVQVLSINRGTTGDLTIEAKFTPNTNTPYQVEHYKMDLNGNYGEVFETDNLTGTTDTDVTPSVKTYEGFESPQTQTVNVEADGSRVVRYYYERNQYTLTLNAGNGIESVSGSGTYYYGQEVSVSATLKLGYSFEKWSNETTTTNFTYKVPAQSETLTATTKLTPYTITYNLDGGTASNPTSYTLETETFTLNNPTKDGYVFGGWIVEGNEPVQTYTINKGTTGNISLSVKWNIIPIIESLSFDIYTDSSLTTPHTIEPFKKGDKAFYVSLPVGAYFDANSISVVFNTEVTLNKNAKEDQTGKYVEVTVEDSKTIKLYMSTIPVKSDNNGKDWYSTSTKQDPFESDYFFAALANYTGNQNINIGVAEGLAVAKDGGELSPHYVSTRKKINGVWYMFFAAEGTETRKITYIDVKGNKISVAVPVGSPAPNINATQIGGYEFEGWYTSSNYSTEYNFDSQLIYEDTTIYGKYNELPVNTSWYDPTETNYDICTNADLQGLSALITSGQYFAGKTINLTCDIDLNNEPWTPMNNFQGTLNGNNHTISNLYISTSSENIGFFKQISGNAKIMNLIFNNVTITGSPTDVGTIAGAISADNSNIEIYRVLLNNVNISGKQWVGGFVGNISKGNIKISESAITKDDNGTSKITSTQGDLGSFVGIINGGQLVYENLISNAELVNNASWLSKSDTGGIFGDQLSGTLTMNNVIFLGTISDSSGRLFGSPGGIYSRAESTTVSGSNSTWLYNKATVSGKGTGKSLDDLRKAATYSGWDTAIWNIQEGSYPTLKWINQ